LGGSLHLETKQQMTKQQQEKIKRLNKVIDEKNSKINKIFKLIKKIEKRGWIMNPLEELKQEFA